MNEEVKTISIKILLTIPALLVGIVKLFLIVLKPTIELWTEKKTEPLSPVFTEESQENHTFM